MNRLIWNVSVLCILVLAGCEQKPTSSAADEAGKPPAAATSDPRRAHPAEPAARPAGAGHGGAVIELGTTTIGDVSVRASRDIGDIKPGGDAPIDVWLTTADGTPAAVTAVRLWIGTQAAKGSVKAKAEIEDPAQTNHWHTHCEVPSPLPDGSQLWIEIETSEGKTAGAVDLKG
jgi:hypothetical protein